MESTLCVLVYHEPLSYISYTKSQEKGYKKPGNLLDHRVIFYSYTISASHNIAASRIFSSSCINLLKLSISVICPFAFSRIFWIVASLLSFFFVMILAISAFFVLHALCFILFHDENNFINYVIVQVFVGVIVVFQFNVIIIDN